MAEVKLDTICKLIGVTTRRYRQLADAGVVPAVEKGMVDFFPAIKQSFEYYRAIIQEKGGADMEAEKLRLAKITADRNELRLQKERGEVIPTADAVTLWSRVIMTMRSRIMAFGKRLAPVLVGCSSAAEAERLVDERVREVLTELSEIDPRKVPRSATRGRPRKPKTVSTTAKTNRKSVGRPRKSPQSRGQRGIRTVGDVASGVSA